MVGSRVGQGKLLEQYKEDEDERHLEDKILDLMNFEDWMNPSTLYKKYCRGEEDPYCRVQFTSILSELESLGELESKGRGSSKKYRRTDQPVKETKEFFGSPMSEGLPDFMVKRIRVEVQRQVQQEKLRMEEKISGLEEKVEDLEKQDRVQGCQDLKSFSGEGDLDRHDQAILDSLSEEPVGMNQLYKSYSSEVEKPLGKRAVRKHLSKLEAEEHVKSTGSNTGKRYQLD